MLEHHHLDPHYHDHHCNHTRSTRGKGGKGHPWHCRGATTPRAFGTREGGGREPELAETPGQHDHLRLEPRQIRRHSQQIHTRECQIYTREHRIRRWERGSTAGNGGTLHGEVGEGKRGKRRKGGVSLPRGTGWPHRCRRSGPRPSLLGGRHGFHMSTPACIRCRMVKTRRESPTAAVLGAGRTSGGPLRRRRGREEGRSGYGSGGRSWGCLPSCPSRRGDVGAR
jgi:hypothetical protein